MAMNFWSCDHMIIRSFDNDKILPLHCRVECLSRSLAAEIRTKLVVHLIPSIVVMMWRRRRSMIIMIMKMRRWGWCDDSELTFTRSSSLPASSSSVLVWPSKPSETCSPNTIGKQSWHYDACPILKRRLVSPYIQVEQGGWQVDDKLQYPPTLPALDQSSWSPATQLLFRPFFFL